MKMIWSLIGLTLVGGVLSLVGGLMVLAFSKQVDKFVLEMISFAAGVMLAVATLDLLPESLDFIEPASASKYILGGVLFLFLLERTSLWFHHHHEAHEKHAHIFPIWLGDTMHNFIDGIVIAVAYLTNPTLGVATTLAVAAHELPQEIADFSIYLRAGIKKLRIIWLNLLSSLATVVGAVSVFLMRERIEYLTGPLLAFTTGMFLYIALADLIPELHLKSNKLKMMRQTISFALGIVCVFGMGLLISE